jgi:hypothetical protein
VAGLGRPPHQFAPARHVDRHELAPPVHVAEHPQGFRFALLRQLLEEQQRFLIPSCAGKFEG